MIPFDIKMVGRADGIAAECAGTDPIGMRTVSGINLI